MGTKDSGKRDHQKLKPYIILQILQRETDENHVMSAVEIAAALSVLGIDAERRSIYRDIEEINKVNWLLENQDSTIEDAEEAPKGSFNEPLGASLFCCFQGAARKILEFYDTFCDTEKRKTPENSLFSGVLVETTGLEPVASCV